MQFKIRQQINVFSPKGTWRQVHMDEYIEANPKMHKFGNAEFGKEYMETSKPSKVIQLGFNLAKNNMPNACFLEARDVGALFTGSISTG